MNPSVTVRHILNLHEFRDCTVLAGEQALDRAVDAIMIAETPDIAEELPENTLVVTKLSHFRNCGDGGEGEAALKQWMQELNGAGVSAVIVKTGRYVEDVPDSIREQTERMQLPLIQAPDEARIVDFVNTFTRFLFQTESLEPVHVGNCLDFFRRCLNYSLMSPGEQAAFEMGAEINGYILSKPYHLLIYPDGEKTESAREQLFFKMLLLLRDYDPQAFGAQSDEQTILFCHIAPDGYGGTSAEVSALPVIRQCNTLLEQEDLKLYTSRKLRGAGEIEPSFHIIKSCIRVDRALRFYSPKSPVTYEKRMFVRMLNQVLMNRSLCEEYVNVILMAPIRDETMQRQKEIRQFLRTYFRLDGKVKDIAAYTNTHPNTVQYRIQYIEKVYDCNLKDTRVQQTLQLALLLSSLLKADIARGGSGSR